MEYPKKGLAVQFIGQTSGERYGTLAIGHAATLDGEELRENVRRELLAIVASLGGTSLPEVILPILVLEEPTGPIHEPKMR